MGAVQYFEGARRWHFGFSEKAAWSLKRGGTEQSEDYKHIQITM